MVQWCEADGTAYLRAGLDVAVCKQVFVQPSEQLVEVGGRVTLSVALIRQMLVAVFLQLPERALLFEQGVKVTAPCTSIAFIKCECQNKVKSTGCLCLWNFHSEPCTCASFFIHTV